jgi:2-methylcitrate dehydratase
MPEPFARRLARVTSAVRLDALPVQTRDALRISIADTVGCAIGAARMAGGPDVARIARALGEDGPVPIVGTAGTAAAGAAAFANVALSRYLDFNDTCIGRRNPAHASDAILGLWGLAAQCGASGATLGAGIVAAYGTIAWLCEHCDILGRGWDTVTPLAVGATAGACRILELGDAATAHALGIAAVDNVTLIETRRGQISDWKGQASGSAVRKGLFAAQLAAAGVTGPLTGFDGRNGLFGQLGAAPDTLEVEARLWERVFECVHLKSAPVQYFAQGAVEIGERIGRRAGDAERVASIKVRTNAVLYRGTAADRARWRPSTRETADHSLPFCVAVPLMKGALRLQHFAPEVLADPALHAVMDRIEAVEDPELEAAYPQSLDVVAEVRLDDGVRFEERVGYPLGHVRRPMSPAQVLAKFTGLAGGAPDRAAPLWAAASEVIDRGEVLSALAQIAHGARVDDPHADEGPRLHPPRYREERET